MPRPIPYSEEELAWIEERKTTPRRELHRAFVERFGRSDVRLAAFKNLCKRKGWLTGRTGRYEAGSVPANKGKKMPYNPNVARTQFKKGHRPQNTKYLGHERIDGNGYIQVSVAEENPYTGYHRRYVHKHRHLWEEANGPVPEGMALKCLDGDKTNTDPSNWKLIPRAMLPRLNGRFGRGYDNAPADLKPTILATAEVEHAARELRRRGGANPSEGDRDE